MQQLYALGRLPRYAKSVQPSTADSLLLLKREKQSTFLLLIYLIAPYYIRHLKSNNFCLFFEKCYIGSLNSEDSNSAVNFLVPQYIQFLSKINAIPNYCAIFGSHICKGSISAISYSTQIFLDNFLRYLRTPCIPVFICVVVLLPNQSYQS